MPLDDGASHAKSAEKTSPDKPESLTYVRQALLKRTMAAQKAAMERLQRENRDFRVQNRTLSKEKTVLVKEKDVWVKEKNALAAEVARLTAEAAQLRAELTQRPLAAAAAEQEAGAQASTAAAGAVGVAAPAIAGAAVARKQQQLQWHQELWLWERVCLALKDDLLSLLAVAGTCAVARVAVRSPALWPTELDLFDFEDDYRVKTRSPVTVAFDGTGRPRDALGFFTEMLLRLLAASPAAAARITAVTIPRHRCVEAPVLCRLLRRCTALRQLTVRRRMWRDTDQSALLAAAAEARAPLHTVRLVGVSSTTAAAALRDFPIESLYVGNHVSGERAAEDHPEFVPAPLAQAVAASATLTTLELHVEWSDPPIVYDLESASLEEFTIGGKGLGFAVGACPALRRIDAGSLCANLWGDQVALTEARVAERRATFLARCPGLAASANEAAAARVAAAAAAGGGGAAAAPRGPPKAWGRVDFEMLCRDASICVM